MNVKKSSRYNHVADWQSARQPDREKTLQEEPISPVEVQHAIKQMQRKKESERHSQYAGKKKRTHEEDKEKKAHKDEYRSGKITGEDAQTKIKSCPEQNSGGIAYSSKGEISTQKNDCTTIDVKA